MVAIVGPPRVDLALPLQAFGPFQALVRDLKDACIAQRPIGGYQPIHDHVHICRTGGKISSATVGSKVSVPGKYGSGRCRGPLQARMPEQRKRDIGRPNSDDDGQARNR